MKNDLQDNYDWYQIVGYILAVAPLAILLAFAFMVAGCSTTGVQGTVNGTVADPAITLGRSSSVGTGTRLPHGGTDEKSNATPTKPTD